ncbi:MAG: response regulator [Candidatus Krumholzibacteria bacterium]|nr:response regulator [Candidatus Krumholzibacteria bacterium]MDH4335675.1 response regulator [Candidatus Krumholzibacteria bacterium]
MERILVVDDSQEARDLAGECLRDHGMTPIFACNGREAMSAIEDHPPDAVLTDLHMPEMDGLELVRLVRSRFSGLPVVLMTSQGSEETAVSALRAGALSYVPKAKLRNNLCDAMGMVMAAVEERRFRERTRSLLEHSEASFLLGYEMDGPNALISHLQGNLRQVNFCDDTELFQIGTALAEALSNAIDHGNLELDSAIREQGADVYAELRQQRATQDPYRDRRVRVTETLRPDVVQYRVQDEGKGFDVSCVPDPLHPDCLLKVSGRGLLLLRTFMDDVTFNATGSEVTMTRRRRTT